MSNGNIPILANKNNYINWYNYVTTTIEKEGLLRYIEEDLKDEINFDKPLDSQKVLAKENATVRLIIIKTVSDDIQKEIAGLKSSYKIMKKLTKKYGGDESDVSYWFSKLNSIKAKSIMDIMNSIESIKEIFEILTNKNFNVSDKEKIKFLYVSLPEDYRSKFILKDDDTFENLYSRIEQDIKNMSYVQNWKNESGYEKDDPMEIDAINKFKKFKNFKHNNKSNNKFNNNYYNHNRSNNNNKYCHICEKAGHETRECWYNNKNRNNYKKPFNNRNNNNRNNKNYHNNNNYYNNTNNNNFNTNNKNKKSVGYIGYIDDYDINDNYDYNTNFEDIRPYLDNKMNNNNYNHDNNNFNNYNNGNMRNACFIGKIIENNNKNQFTRENNVKNISNVNNSNVSEWLYDSGAGEHLTNDITLLNNYVKGKETLKCANNSLCDFEGHGEFGFNINKYNVKLDKVLYSNELSRNILSGIELARTGIKTLTESDDGEEVKVILMDKHYNVINTYYANENNEVIIKVNNNRNINNINNINYLNKESQIIWHRRLGHYYIRDLDKYLHNHNINDNLCYDCKISKLNKSPHNKTPPRVNNILEVIHSDIIGPISTSITGKKYILTMIDEYSRKSWIFLLKNKSEAPKYIIFCLKYLNNIFEDIKVKKFKSDNAKEYNNKIIKEYCLINGIVKEFSPPYNPENNGLAERFNQTLISCTKTILYWSKLSVNFWDFAVKYANYLYNKTPHSGISNNIPDEVFHNNKVKLYHIRVFGCITYYKNLNEPNNNKFDPNTKKGVFLGFDESSNSYIIMDYNNHKIYKTRDIVCQEDIPANLSIPNNYYNHESYPSFFEFYFNFANSNSIYTGDNSGTDTDFSPQNTTYKNSTNNEKIIINNSKNLSIPEDSNNTKNNNNLNNNTQNLNNNIETSMREDYADNNNTSNNDDNNIYKHTQNNTTNNFDDSENIKNISNKNFSDKKIFDNKNFENINNKTLINNKLINSQNNNSISDNKNFNLTNEPINNNLIYPNINNSNVKKFSYGLIDDIDDNSSEEPMENLPNNEPLATEHTTLNNYDSNNSVKNIQQATNNIKDSNNNNDTINSTKVAEPHHFQSTYISHRFPGIRLNRRIKTLVIDNNPILADNINNLKNKIYNKIYNPSDDQNNNNNNDNNDNNNNINNGNINNINNFNNSNTNNKKRKNYFNDSNVKKYRDIDKYKCIASTNFNIPTSYYDAVTCKHKNLWIKAIKEELNNLYSNNIMTYVKHLPKYKNVISTKWVFSLKRDDNNKIIKFKARLVARGFKQKQGIDYELTYSPTLNIDCLKLILALASKFRWSVQQLDIKAAYLNADLDKEIYTTIPQGDKNYQNGFWKLNKALYGLKQSGRQWNKTITDFLINNGFEQLLSEKCLFKRVINNKLICLIGIYVDDMVITGEKYEIDRIINLIKLNYKISNSEKINYILGIKVINNNNNTYSVTQENFIDNILEKFNTRYTRKINTPCIGENTKIENNKPFNITTYKSAIGMLIYLSRCTRPDIAFAVNRAARNSENPTHSDWIRVTHILKYLNFTKHYKINYDGYGDIVAFTDADFAGDMKDRKSTSGHIILMGKNPICWYSKKQSIVATSTQEAEYISTSECIKRVLWIKNILYELLRYKRPITIFTDNIPSKSSYENGEIGNKLKHISIKYHFTKDYIEKGYINLKYVESRNMLADVLTKFSNGSQIYNFSNKIFKF